MVSVIIPVYNTEQYLEECILSIVNQTYNELEIIIINDGSTDGSGDIGKKWEILDKRIRYIEKENEGQGIARNTGIQLATGEYILFVDSDDYIDENLIDTVYNYMLSEKADICVYAHNGVGDKVYKTPLEFKVIHGNSVKENKELFGNMMPILWDKMFSSSLIKNSKIMMSNRICEDLVFNAQLYVQAERICTLDIPFYYYRYKRNGNLSTNYQRYVEVEQSINELNEIFKRDGYFEHYWIQLYKISFEMFKDILFRIKKREDLEIPISLKNKYYEFVKAYKDCLNKWFSPYLSINLQEKNYLLIGSYNLRVIIHTLLLDEDFLREDYGYSSIISLMSKPVKLDLSLESCEFINPYRKRCVVQDIHKHFYFNVNLQDKDYIVMDLLDEIFDLIEINEQTFITESEFIKELHLEKLQAYRRIPFLSRERRELFEIYIKRFAEKINKVNIPIILIKNFLCEKRSEYYDVFMEYEQLDYIQKVNRELEWCYQKICDCLWNVIVVDASEFKELVFTYEDFPFGCEPVYYNKCYYQRMAIQIGRCIHDKVCK